MTQSEESLDENFFSNLKLNYTLIFILFFCSNTFGSKNTINSNHDIKTNKIYIMDKKEEFIKMKQERREKKRIGKRSTHPEEVIFIFEKVLEHWKTIRIYNTIVQNNPNSHIDKKTVERIATGNSKVYQSELSNDRFQYYQDLREKVYQYIETKKKPLPNI